MRVVAGHDAAQAGFVSDDLAVEDGVPGELGEPGFGLGAGRPSQRRSVFVGTQLGEQLATGEGLLGFDLIAEAGVAGAGVALEHLNALVAVLQCCRAVTHITTAGDEPVQIGGVTVYRETDSRDLVQRAQQLIPAIPTAFDGDLPFIYAPPHALLVSTAAVPQGDAPYDAGRRASSTISRFLMLARLLHAGSHQSGWEITGASTFVAEIRPQPRAFNPVQLGSLLERVVRLSPDDAPAFAALSDFIDAVVIKRDGMAATSFGTALYRYNRAHEEGDNFERIVDLATALEAVLTDDDKGEGLSLRLKNRAAALLATTTDTGTSIFSDITKLYELRSRLVHGGSIQQKDLVKIITSVSAVPDGAMFGVALAFAVDRMRDLVRRSFLARLCLGSGTEPLWPFGKSTPVDAALADDATRGQWRHHWRDQLANLGAALAAEPARPGIDPITRRSDAQTHPQHSTEPRPR
ncbi:HEPN domain-containing protein [Streptomyces mirabilis]|nr:HEPN domain-containing protein [Streptomyces mirabilis]